MLSIYNSLHDTVEPFTSIEPGKVSMYVCGPTVYNYIHIGNARPIIIFDVVRNYLTYSGYDVDYVSNITDVDDKIIAAAVAQAVDEQTLTELFTKAYQDDVQALGSNLAPTMPKVTESMTEIITFIEQLIEKGYAYVAEGAVYFRVTKLPEYGTLSNQKMNDLLVGARIEENHGKENPLDFTLWKATTTGVSWESPWSTGRPGWHTECVVMIDAHFSKKIDIHGGGMDLKFPHHENEIAQSQACFEHGLANYWMHNGFVQIDDEKMSKSLGNFKTVRAILEQYEGTTVRTWMLSTHYRQPINFSLEALDSAEKFVERTKTAYRGAFRKLDLADAHLIEPIFDEAVESIKQGFEAAMDDDFNTANAMTILFELVKVLNQYTRQNVQLDQLQAACQLFVKIDQVLGLHLSGIEPLSVEIKHLFHERERARQAKDFTKADEIRQQLAEKGIEV
ncbi:MAG: cysteine--tRNA ligase [Culicoidibacterales bacterium]